MAARKIYFKYVIYAVILCVATITISCGKEINVTNVQPSVMDTSIDLSLPTDTSFIPLNVPDTSVKSYLALGDSYTIGQSVSEADRFPNQVVQLLRNENIK